MRYIHIYLFFPRCSSRGARTAVRPKTSAVLPAVRLRRRAALRPKMEGGQAGSTAGDGGVCDVTARRHYRTHIPGSGQYGKSHFDCNLF